YVRTGLVKVDFRGLAVVTRASEPALRYTLAASRQNKLWQVAELFYENQSRLNELATDKGVKQLVRGQKGLDPVRLRAAAPGPPIPGAAEAPHRHATPGAVPA